MPELPDHVKIWIGTERRRQEELAATEAQTMIAAFTALGEAGRQLVQQIADAFRPAAENLARSLAALTARVKGNRLEFWATGMGMRSHTVWVCSEWECNARMDRQGDELVCVNGHRWDVERIMEAR